MESAISPIPPFVEEIDVASIELFEVVGKGTFGTVKKGKWRDKDVAVKLIETEQEKKAFLVEVRQLSRVDHPNIVKLYGACTKSSNVCLVMEYAEGGSLYNVLHRMPNTHYTAAHALSWALQCAKGVAYLHNMKPKALIHRDLKPPNMLLILSGTVLKICDFGTACDLQTVMTNSKGSAAWMAPEVFESINYSEKCDVFSWGIILWEILTRKKPFDDIGGPAFRIMWAVHNGQRPPLISGCPEPLEDLMTSCWSKEPSERPSMTEVEHKLSNIMRYFKGGHQPITVLSNDQTAEADSRENSVPEEGQPESLGTGSSTCVGTSVLAPLNPSPHKGQQTKTGFPFNMGRGMIPGNSPKARDVEKRRSADFSIIQENRPQQPLGHRRSGSWGNPLQPPLPSRNSACVRAGSRDSLLPPEAAPRLSPRPLGPLQLEPPNMAGGWPSPNASSSGEETPIFANLNAHLLLEPKLQPLPPAPNCPESQALYESHCQMAQEYLKVKTETEFIITRKKELSKMSEREQLNSSLENLNEFLQLQNDKEGLLELRKNLKKQLEVIRAQRNMAGAPKGNSDEWVMI